MNYEDCIEEYGSQNADYCSSFPHHQPNLFDVIGGFFGFIGDNILWIILGIVVIILIGMALHVVREKEAAVVERLGRYNRTLQAGFRITIPFFEKIVTHVDLQLLDFRTVSIIKTKEDQIIELPLVITVKATQAEAQKAYYEVENPKKVIKAMVANEVKAKAATMTLKEIYEDRDTIKDLVVEKLTSVFAGYGFELTNVVIDDPELSEEMEEALESVSIAKLKQQAATANGKALKIELVAKATADAASLTIKTDAYVTSRGKIAEGNADALKKMIGETDLTAAQGLGFLANIDRLDAIRDAADSGATVVIDSHNSAGATFGMIADNAK